MTCADMAIYIGDGGILDHFTNLTNFTNFAILAIFTKTHYSCESKFFKLFKT